jgi:hypothetical protein
MWCPVLLLAVYDGSLVTAKIDAACNDPSCAWWGRCHGESLSGNTDTLLPGEDTPRPIGDTALH